MTGACDSEGTEKGGYPTTSNSDTTVDVPVAKQRREDTIELHDEVKRNPDGQDAFSISQDLEQEAKCLPWPFWLKPFLVPTCAVFFPFTSVSGLSCPSDYNPVFVISVFPWHV